jgi:hypothetical protein
LCFNSEKVQLSSGKQLRAWLEDPESEDDENQGEHARSDHDSSSVGKHSVDQSASQVITNLEAVVTLADAIVLIANKE